MTNQKYSTLANEISLNKSIYTDCHEHKANKGSKDDSYHLDALEPYRAIPTHSLEHAPESMYKMKPYGSEPDQIDYQNPPLSKHCSKQQIRIIFKSADMKKLRHLHLGPEMEKMEPRITIPSTNMLRADQESAAALLDTS